MNRQTDGQSYRQCSQFNRFPYIITYHSLLLLAHIFINSFQRLVFVSPYSVIFSFCQLTLQLDGCVAKFNILVSARDYFPHLQIVSFGVQKLKKSRLLISSAARQRLISAYSMDPDQTAPRGAV